VCVGIQVQSLSVAVHRQQATTFHIQPPTSSAAAAGAGAGTKKKTLAPRDQLTRDKPPLLSVSSVNIISTQQQQQPLFLSPFN